MSELPSSWSWTSLKGLKEFSLYGPRFSSDDYADEGVSVLRTSDISEGGKVDINSAPKLPLDEEQFEKYKCKTGDLLITRTGSLGTLAVFNDKVRAIPGAYLIQYRLLSPEITNWYIYTFLKSSAGQRELTGGGAGVGRPNLNAPKIDAIQIPLPPLNEQKRIVAKIEELFSELDAGEASLRQAKHQLGVYRQSLLKQAFEGKLSQTWRTQNPDKLESPDHLLVRIQSERRSRYEEQLKEWEAEVLAWEQSGKEGKRPKKPKSVKATNPPTAEELESSLNISTEWQLVPAEEIGEVQLGRQRSPKNVSKDYPTKYIRAANITEAGLALEDILEMEFSPSERKTFGLTFGDLVLSEASGSASQVGKPAMWKGEIPNCCFQNTVIRHRLHILEYSEFYLWLYRFFYLHGTFSKTAGGVGINHLSAGKFARIPVPLCSLAEQQEIVRLLDAQFSVIEQNEREIDDALRRSEALRQSILKKAFTGQLVPQDPTDEPASQLLEKIQSQQEAEVPQEKTAKRAAKKAVRKTTRSTSSLQTKKRSKTLPKPTQSELPL